MAKLKIAASFADDMQQVYSERLENRIYALLGELEAFPELGVVDARPSIRARFGTSIRKLVVGPFDLFYRYNADGDEVHVDALMSQRAIV